MVNLSLLFVPRPKARGMEIIMHYTERLRGLREDNDLTQTDIAEILHIGQRTYADYELGKTWIPLDSMIILAKFYDVSMDYICCCSNVPGKFPLT